MNHCLSELLLLMDFGNTQEELYSSKHTVPHLYNNVPCTHTNPWSAYIQQKTKHKKVMFMALP